MDWGIFKWVVAGLLIAGAMLLSVISLKKHGEFLVKLGKINPSLSLSLDWDYFGDGASKRGYQIMVFFYKRKYVEINDKEVVRLGSEIRRLNGYSIFLAAASMITLSL